MSEIISEFRTKFKETEKSFNEITHPVWFGGQGPPIILMHELDGFIPAFMQLSMRLSESFSVYAPVFYGNVGESVNELKAFFCMRKEFEAFRLETTSPITDWIRSLASDIYLQNDEKQGVGIVGMCMTGGIVLATISHPSVSVGVAAQPSLPFGFIGSKKRREDLGLNPQDLAAAVSSKTPVLTLRYGKDPICPAERISSILKKIPSAQKTPGFLDNVSSHPTLTDLYREGKGEEIQKASDQAITQTISFLSKYLT